jgi:uncharacterized protein (TIGR02611 family)
MSPGAEGNTAPEAEHATATMEPAASGKPDGRPQTPDSQAPEPEHDHHVLLDADEDRWRWRRRIRQNPRKLWLYRIAVAIAGLLMICLGFVSGPLPGPGGIPLVLLGLAIWSSEFEWANHLMVWFKLQLKRYRAWPRRKKVLFWVVFFAVCGGIWYCYLLLTGVPGWLPAAVEMTLLRLPGL